MHNACQIKLTDIIENIYCGAFIVHGFMCVMHKKLCKNTVHTIPNNCRQRAPQPQRLQSAERARLYPWHAVNIPVLVDAEQGWGRAFNISLSPEKGERDSPWLFV